MRHPAFLAIVATAGVVASYVVAGPERPARPHPVRGTPVSTIDADAVMFVVSGATSDVWRVGTLDRFDGQAWRLPPWLGDPVPGSDPPPSPIAGVTSTALLTIHTPRGVVLPTPPLVTDNSWDRAAYDETTGTFRLGSPPRNGTSFEVRFHPIPPEDALLSASARPGRAFLGTRDLAPPGRLARLLLRTRERTPWREATAIYSRLRTLRTTSEGHPVPIDERRIREILTERETTAFEFVALGTLALRWAGVPARLAYGYQQGTDGNGSVFRARDFGLWTEVALDGIGWVPVPGSITALPSALPG